MAEEKTQMTKKEEQCREETRKPEENTFKKEVFQFWNKNQLRVGRAIGLMPISGHLTFA